VGRGATGQFHPEGRPEIDDDGCFEVAHRNAERDDGDGR
jgi:hypothetical protein